MKVMSDGYMYGHNCSTDGYEMVLGSGGCETQLNMKRSEFVGDFRESFRQSRLQSQLAFQCCNLAQYLIPPVLRYGGMVSDTGPSCNTETQIEIGVGTVEHFQGLHLQDKRPQKATRRKAADDADVHPACECDVSEYRGESTYDVPGCWGRGVPEKRRSDRGCVNFAMK